MQNKAVSRRLSAFSLGIILLSGCAATRSGPSQLQREYVKAHPLSPAEQQRLYAREAQRGDTIDRVRVTCDDCGFERQTVDGAIAVWRVHLPIDVRPFRLVLDTLAEVAPGSDVLLTFKSDRLDSAVVLP